ncbi:MAG: cupin domain-containing protein [Ignavibacteriae bacterium]|nr:cupin domain-containing protein [Ignavibacteriota bacterium]
MKNPEYWIDKLQMKPHPEGGYFKEVYRSEESYSGEHLPERFGGDRSHSTSIYFLLVGEQVSKFHRIKSDEVWHFYEGSPVMVHRITRTGELKSTVLGRNHDAGEQLQFAVPHGEWFGAEVNNKDSYSLVGCTVAPGFHFEDFELAERDTLQKEFPDHIDIIQRLT